MRAFIFPGQGSQAVGMGKALADASPVLDVGCGRGEVLAALAARGVQGIGVDLDAGMVAEAKAAGVDARQGDAIAFLNDAEPESFGAVIAIQVVEHLSLEALLTSRRAHLAEARQSYWRYALLLMLGMLVVESFIGKV